MTRSLLTSPCSSEPIVLLQRFCVCSYFWWSGLSFYSLLWNLHVLPNSLRPDATLRCCLGVCCDGSRCCRRRFYLTDVCFSVDGSCQRDCVLPGVLTWTPLCQLSDDVFYLQAKEQRLSGRTCLWMFNMKATIWVQIRWSTLTHYYTSCLLRLFTLQCCCHVQRCLRCDCWSLMNEPLLFSWPDARLVFRVRCVLHIADSGEQQEERVVRWVLGGELQLQTDELVQERRQQQEVHRWVYFL